MYKKNTQDPYWPVPLPKKWIMKISLTSIFLTTFCIHLSASSFGQQVTLNVTNSSIKEVFNEIHKQSGYNFLWSVNSVPSNIKVTVHAKSAPIDAILKQALRGLPLTYELDGKLILIREKPIKTQMSPGRNEISSESGVSDVKIVRQDYDEVKGRVVDSIGNPVAGATVRLYFDDNRRLIYGVSTDGQGRFSLRGVPKNSVIEITHVSYSGGLQVKPRPDLGILVLKGSTQKIDEVVVSSGIVNRRAESFTGAARTITREELLQAGNQNVLKSIKNLDPSFIIVENLSLGSNPNALPEVQLRGQNSLPNLQGDFSGNANEPLFILDGFETTLQRVFDLNMNRIASVTLLKDAAAKAIYGSRAGNGVVVIETIRPKSGELRLSYSADMSVEVPDLTGYNLMNAGEKLAFEKERGMYSRFISGPEAARDVEQIYKTNYDNVVKGVDTYWLSQPLRTGISTKHALNLEGGDGKMSYSVGVTYADNSGVMKKSGRQTMGVNSVLSYTYKNLIFRNNIEYNRNEAMNSPYGSFVDYVNLNQYYQPYDERGLVKKVLGVNRSGEVYNPLYNATLNTKNRSGYSEFIDNFNVEWRIKSNLRATGSVAYSRNESTSDVFYPASHTMFAGYTDVLAEQKGKYTKGSGYSQLINSNIGLNYNFTAGKHLIFANGTWNLTSRRNVSNSYTAVGFGNDHMDDISFASSYDLYGKPTGYDAKVREIGLIGLINYSYADRFLLDASIRTSGSSMYGSENRWGNFWSLGTGWNVHKEKFFENQTWLNRLKIRGSMGYTGSQNFNPFQSRARYTYGDIIYNGKLGAELMGLPNPFLKWQRIMDYNAGLDFELFKNVVTGRFDYFVQNAKDLLTDMTIVPSMGFTSYKENIGETQNKGFEISLSVTPWRDKSKQGWVTLTGTALHRANKLTKIYDTFDSWNKSQDKNLNLEITDENYTDLTLLRGAYTKPKTYLYEGQSMNAIWGVRSLGIDPMTGKEMYLDKNGNSTWVWSTGDQVVIGDVTPKLSGNLNLSAGYKGFSLSMICSYKFGGDIYNTTLIDRVENVTGYDNLDRRILDSWRQTGDIAPYRALSISAQTDAIYTPPTSRFVQRENEIYISSVNLGYMFTNSPWLKSVKMNNLRCSFYMNELFRTSSVKIERGTTYPFARSFSFMVQAAF